LQSLPSKQLIVILPCFNEAQALPGLLPRLLATRERLPQPWELRVLVVDDGSVDATAEIAEGFPGVMLEVHARNQGLGAALQTGLMSRLAKDAELLAVMDADATHPPELLPTMLSKLETNGLDVVIASRFAPGGAEHGLSAMRRLYSRLAGLAMRILAPVHGVRDYSCGYRLYRRDAIGRALQKFGTPLVTERGFVCMVELLVKLARSGAKMGEVGLDLHYELKQGASKMNVGSTIRRYARFALRARFDPKLR
jgi:dolichol-phosphate mannosyltransferase